MELETVNKLYLELSQFATARTPRELDLEDMLRSAHCIAVRRGEGTAWERFAASIARLGIGSVTARTYRVLESDSELQCSRTQSCVNCGRLFDIEAGEVQTCCPTCRNLPSRQPEAPPPSS